MSIADEISVEDFLKALKIDYENKKHNTAVSEAEFPIGNRAALIAPPAAGKTVTVAGLFMRAQAKVRQTVHTNTPFFARILEKGSDIHQDISNLMDGHFPAKTQQYLGFRSSPGLLLERKKVVDVPFMGKKALWHRMLQLPICDLPGETLAQVIWQVRAQTSYQQVATKNMIENAIAEMRESNAYIFILKASTAKGLGEQIEQEKDPTVSRDPDVNQVRMLEDLANYKARHGDQIKAAYVVITAVDKIQRRAQRLGFDLLSPHTGQKDIENFVASCYQQFYAALHSSGIPIIKYYPMFFQTIKDDEGKEIIFDDPITRKNGDGSLGMKTVQRPHIMTKDLMDPSARTIWENVRKISYSEEQFDKLLDDLMKLAVSR